MKFTAHPDSKAYDTVIIGGGFYGCYLAQHLATLGERVLICEMGSGLMQRASAVNQARVHTGFHYPRSYVTALRSLQNHHRFIGDFGPAICRDFQMIYAIARHGTKVSSERFYGMFKSMNAPISEASPSHRALFEPDQVEGTFACTEYAFDYRTLRKIQLERMADQKIEVCLETKAVQASRSSSESVSVLLASGRSVSCKRIFNVSYSMLNAFLKSSGLASIKLKHELVEIALMERPSYLIDLGITVMDGPFFSIMPWPAANAYSLTHVRHTPHYSWTDDLVEDDPYEYAGKLRTNTRWKHMAAAATSFFSNKEELIWKCSVYDVKTVPIRSEIDDGRPILLINHAEMPGLVSVLGGKIDNIYDLADAI